MYMYVHPIWPQISIFGYVLIGAARNRYVWRSLCVSANVIYTLYNVWK